MNVPFFNSQYHHDEERSLPVNNDDRFGSSIEFDVW